MLDYWILGGILVAAALIRAPGLGRWCFTIDEYYYYNSAFFILDKGIPQFPGGGYYVRGLLIQYLIAFSSYFSPNKEFAARIVPLIFGVLSVPLFYLICRRFLSVLPAFLCSLLLLFSSWHIEFSRYARMYAPFQFAFFSFIYFFHSGYFLKNRNHRIACWVVAFVSVFIYEGSIFLPFLLLLPVLTDETPWNRRTVETMCVFIGLVVTNYLITGINYRDMGVTNPYPVELDLMKSGIDAPFFLPALDLLKEVFHTIPMLLVYILCVLGGSYVYMRQFWKRTGFWDVVSKALAVVFPLIHQYGLMFIVLLMLFVSHKRIFREFLDGRRTWIPYFAITIVFWIAVGSFHEKELLSRGNIVPFLKNTASFLFGYPLLYKTIVEPFSKVTPFWGAFLSLTLFVSIVHCLFSEGDDSRGILILILLVCTLLISTLKTLYSETRYSFFYFPLLYIICYLEISSLSGLSDKYCRDKTC